MMMNMMKYFGHKIRIEILPIGKIEYEINPNYANYYRTVKKTKRINKCQKHCYTKAIA
jgi:hypothetical protein